MPQSGLGSMQWKTRRKDTPTVLPNVRTDRGGRTHSVSKWTDTQGGTHPQCNPTNGHTLFFSHVTHTRTKPCIEAACCLKIKNTLWKDILLESLKWKLSCYIDDFVYQTLPHSPLIELFISHTGNSWLIIPWNPCSVINHSYILLTTAARVR